MSRDVRIKEYFFSTGSLTSSAAGLINVFTDHALNGTIQNVLLLSTNYTSTGSLLLFASGLGNSGTNIVGLITRVSGISVAKEIYPVVYNVNDQGLLQSGTTAPLWQTQAIINAPLRLVGSGLGASKSGLGLSIRYI